MSPESQSVQDDLLFMDCIVCGQDMTRWLDHRIFRCSKCRHLSSAFPNVVPGRAEQELDEVQRQSGLRELRIANAARILTEVRKRVEVQNPTLCDVGSGHGWFLDAAQKAGFQATGIEPDREVAKGAISRGLSVRIGMFPDCLQTSDTFDVIVFNDVFEHLHALPLVIDSCKLHLRQHGVIVLVLPTSDGLLFRIAAILKRIQVRKPWDRLWQRDFPCPHTHYFSAKGLRQLMFNQGLHLEYESELPSYYLKGLWSRIRMETKIGFFRAGLSYLFLLLLWPLMRLSRSDNLLQIYR